MALLIGTTAGLFRVDGGRFAADDPTAVLDCGTVRSLRAATDETVYAGTDDGLYRSPDSGHSWTDRSPPTDSRIWSVLPAGDGALYAGTDDPVLWRSLDDGETWAELPAFRRRPSRGVWASPGDPNQARLRSLDTPPGRPEHLVAGLEVGGVHISEDGGESWQDRRTACQDDIHQVQALSDEVILAATGYFDLALEGLEQGHALAPGGLYRTTDGGASWTRLDAGQKHAYIRAFHCAAGVLCLSGARGPPPAWRPDGVDAALFESTDLGRRFVEVDAPGGRDELVEAWTTVGGEPVGGTARYGTGGESRPLGRLIRRTDGGYRTLGLVPDRVTALTAAP